MDKKTASKLGALNSKFYQTFASQFSSTRQRLQPGVQRILETIPPDARILDLGCGNGEFARRLAEREFQGTYLGLDVSVNLLEIARERTARNFSFIQVDLGDSNWDQTVISHLPPPSTLHPPLFLPHSPFAIRISSFTIITAFATLHHLPSRVLRLRTFRKIRDLLAYGGRFIHSNWQFLNSQRLRQRIQPWSEIGLSDDDVDPGDYLLDWRQGGRGLRYIHHFGEDELALLAAETGFKIKDSFYSDGEGDHLGLYQVWRLPRLLAE